jgi:hypothetical protein
MRLSIYSIYDKTAQAYIQPFYMHNNGLAIRAFQDNVNDNSGNNNINKHPNQFDLYKLGTYDDKTGVIESHSPEVIAHGPELLNPSEEHQFNLDLSTRLDKIEKLLSNLHLVKIKEELNQ